MRGVLIKVNIRKPQRIGLRNQSLPYHPRRNSTRHETSVKPLPAIIKDLISLQTLSDIDRTVVFRITKQVRRYTYRTYLCNVLIDSSQSQQSLPIHSLILKKSACIFIQTHPATQNEHASCVCTTMKPKPNQNLNKVWAVWQYRCSSKT